MSAITDADDADYAATVTCDANLNITEIDEEVDNGTAVNHLYSYFSYDDLNKLANYRHKWYDSSASEWQWSKRIHGYDATGRLVNTTYRTWEDGDEEPSGDSLKHTYAGSRHIQNYDGSSAYGERWHWAGAQHSHASPVKSPNADTASQPIIFSIFLTTGSPFHLLPPRLLLFPHCGVTLSPASPLARCCQVVSFVNIPYRVWYIKIDVVKRNSGIKGAGIGTGGGRDAERGQSVRYG